MNAVCFLIIFTHCPSTPYHLLPRHHLFSIIIKLYLNHINPSLHYSADNHNSSPNPRRCLSILAVSTSTCYVLSTAVPFFFKSNSVLTTPDQMSVFLSMPKRNGRFAPAIRSAFSSIFIPHPICYFFSLFEHSASLPHTPTVSLFRSTSIL